VEPVLDPDLPIIDPHHHLWRHRQLADLGAARLTDGQRDQRRSSPSGDPADFEPDAERPLPCGTVLAGGDILAAKMKKVVDPSCAERKRCAWPADLNRFICRSRRHVG
jgi:predicted TIM-barrel fold metal-dependent hydrolase